MVLRISNLVRRGGTSPAFWLFAMVLMIVCLTNLSSNTNWTGESSFAHDSLTSQRSTVAQLSDGTEVPEMLGVFGFSDHRYKFSELKGERREFVCLENIILERVQQLAQEVSSDCLWIISGRVTQFQGKNFLILESATPAPKPTIASL